MKKIIYIIMLLILIGCSSKNLTTKNKNINLNIPKQEKINKIKFTEKDQKPNTKENEILLNINKNNENVSKMLTEINEYLNNQEILRKLESTKETIIPKSKKIEVIDFNTLPEFDEDKEMTSDTNNQKEEVKTYTANNNKNQTSFFYGLQIVIGIIGIFSVLIYCFLWIYENQEIFMIWLKKVYKFVLKIFIITYRIIKKILSKIFRLIINSINQRRSRIFGNINSNEISRTFIFDRNIRRQDGRTNSGYRYNGRID